MATALTTRQLDRQFAHDLIAKQESPTVLDTMKAEAFSNTVGIQSDSLRETILSQMQASKPDKGYTADEAAQMAENISKDKTIEWPFLQTYTEDTGNRVARTSLSDQSTRLLEILKDNPIDSFDRPTPTLMDYGTVLLNVELNQRPNMSQTEQLPSLLRGIETAAHHNAYNQYHATFSENDQPLEDYMDIAIDAKERTKPFIEAVYNDPKINRHINSDKKSFYDLSTDADGILKDKNVANALFPEHATEYDQRVLIDAIDVLPYSAQQEAAESLKLSKDFGMDFSLEGARENLTYLMELRDKTYPNIAADDLSQKELFSESFSASIALNNEFGNDNVVSQSSQAEAIHQPTIDSSLAQVDTVDNVIKPSTDSINLHSLVEPVTGSDRVNNALDELNRDYVELSSNAQFSDVPTSRLVTDSLALFKKADDFGRMANEIATSPSGIDVSPQDLDKALKGISNYVDEAAHIAQFVTHDTDSMMDIRSRSRTAMTNMDNHRLDMTTHIKSLDNTNTQLSHISRDLKNDYANNMLLGINKDFDDLSKRVRDNNPDTNMISNKGLDFLENANAFSNVVNAIADKSRGDQEYQQELKDTLKDISAYVDDASHSINQVNHNTDNMVDMLNKTRSAMEGMDKHRETLDTTITNFNEVAPAPVASIENTHNPIAPPR